MAGKISKGLMGVLAIVSVAAYLFFYEPPYRGLIQPTQQTLIFAHRGFGNGAPDNSLIGATMAMDNKMDGVDMDCQKTSDDKLVVFHDLSVDRLTTSTGKVTSKTLDELCHCDLGKKFGKGFEKRAPVASLRDFVKAIPSRGILMVELKVPSAKPTGIEEQAIAIVRDAEAFDRVYFSSFNPLVLYRLKKADPRIHTVLIFMDTNWNPKLLAEIKKEDLVNLPWALRQEWIRCALRKWVQPDALSVNNEVDEKVIDRLIKKGNPVFLWTIDEESRLRWALGKRPYGVISDQPLRAKALRDELIKNSSHI